MAELKTKKNEASVKDFLASVADDRRRQDAEQVCKIMQEITKEPPKMWGSSIIGFGSYHYKSPSGSEGDWMMIGLSPRKNALTLYVLDSYEFESHQQLLKKLGKHKTSKGCLYITRLSDVDLDVLREIIATSFKRVKSGKFLQKD